MSRKYKRRRRRQKRSRPVTVKQVSKLYLNPSKQLTLWSAGDFVRVAVGDRVTQMPGNWKRHYLLVSASDLRCWGLGSGEPICDEDKRLLMQMMEQRSAQSPWMRIRFVTEQERKVQKPIWKQKRNRFFPWRDVSLCYSC